LSIPPGTPCIVIIWNLFIYKEAISTNKSKIIADLKINKLHFR
jgi:hypothetical protein